MKLEQLDSEMLKPPQTQKKGLWIYSKDKIYQDVQREKMTTGFNLLKKWVPAIEKASCIEQVRGKKSLNRPEMLMETVSYIK